MKEDLFCEGELVTVVKGLKNDKALGADSLVNEFFKYGGHEVRNKLLKIMNMSLEKGEIPSKLLSMMIHFTLKDAVDKVFKEEQYGIRNGRGCVNQILTLRLVI